LSTDLKQHKVQNRQKWPKISIVIPILNLERFIEATITSIIHQGYPNLELIIIDGGSTDKTIKIIDKYRADVHYFISEKDNGMYDALNKGFKKATGGLMTYLNGDDILLPNSLFAIAQMFTDLTDIDWIQGRSAMINEYGHIISPGHLNNSTLFDYMSEDLRWIGQDGTFWRKSLWDKVGEIDSKYRYAGDFQLFNCFFDYAKLYSTQVMLSAFRYHNGQLHSIFFEKYMLEVRQIISEKRYPLSLQKQQKKAKNFYKFALKIPGLRNTELIKNKIDRAFNATPLIEFDLSTGKYKLGTR
jgi:glycosyltransferase involved in cell wall biosynthesis